jgi:hypothetical protein
VSGSQLDSEWETKKAQNDNHGIENDGTLAVQESIVAFLRAYKQIQQRFF